MKLTHFTVLAVVTVAAGLLVYPNVQAATARDKAELVRACRTEAVLGHLRHLGTQRLAIDAHRRRMTGLCDRWQTAGAAEREDLLQSCITEATWGARHIHRGGNHDRSHMMRQQRLCEKLAVTQ